MYDWAKFGFISSRFSNFFLLASVKSKQLAPINAYEYLHTYTQDQFLTQILGLLENLQTLKFRPNLRQFSLSRPSFKKGFNTLTNNKIHEETKYPATKLANKVT